MAGEGWTAALTDVAELTDVIGGVSQKEEHEVACRPDRVKPAASEQRLIRAASTCRYHLWISPSECP